MLWFKKEAADPFPAPYRKSLEEVGEKAPVNAMSGKHRNRGVFNFAYQAFESQGQAVDCCRAVFVPTVNDGKDRLWKGSGINPRAHIQVVVRNPACILGTWLVKPLED